MVLEIYLFVSFWSRHPEHKSLKRMNRLMILTDSKVEDRKSKISVQSINSTTKVYRLEIEGKEQPMLFHIYNRYLVNKRYKYTNYTNKSIRDKAEDRDNDAKEGKIEDGGNCLETNDSKAIEMSRNPIKYEGVISLSDTKAAKQYYQYINDGQYRSLKIFIYRGALIHISTDANTCVYYLSMLKPVYTSQSNKGQHSYFNGWINFNRNACMTDNGRVFYTNNTGQVVCHEMEHHLRNKNDDSLPEYTVLQSDNKPVDLCINSACLFVLSVSGVVSYCPLKIMNKDRAPFSDSFIMMRTGLPEDVSDSEQHRMKGNCITSNDRFVVYANYSIPVVITVFRLIQRRRNMKALYGSYCKDDKQGMGSQSNNSVHNMILYSHGRVQYLLVGYLFNVISLFMICRSGTIHKILSHQATPSEVSWTLFPSYTHDDIFILAGSGNLFKEIHISYE